MNHHIFLLVSLIVWATCDDEPYCGTQYQSLCKGKGLHVGCQFPDIGPGASCRNYRPIKFHNDLKHFITHYINRRRQRIASGSGRVRDGLHLPRPELMMMVEWDWELASLAQRLADQCTFAHDDCRATVRYPYAGQTVGEMRWRRSSGHSLTPQRAIRSIFDAWWGERTRIEPHQLTQPFKPTTKGAVWGHYSQLAVWSLRGVGCGAVRHGQYPRLLLVCDYSHTNMLGQRTLAPGPLARCPEHTERRPRSPYPLLCAPVRGQIRIDSHEENLEDKTQPKRYEFDLEEYSQPGRVELSNNVSSAAVEKTSNFKTRGGDGKTSRKPATKYPIICRQC